MTAEPTAGQVRCIRRAGSTFTRCTCDPCIQERRAQDASRRRGEPAVVVDRDAGWDAFQGLLDAGWTPSAVADAYGVPLLALQSAAQLWRDEGHRTRFGQMTTAKLLGGPSRAPMVGYVPPLGSMRRARALAAVGWTCADMARLAGLSRSAVSDAQSGRRSRVHAGAAAALVGVFDRLGGQVGGSSQALVLARRAGWAPPYVWVGVDVDDPGVCPEGFPKADVPSLSRVGAQGVARRRAAGRAAWAARGGRSGVRADG